MGKKQRERKLAALEQVQAEKAAIIERRKDRLEPVYRMTRKFILALFFTVLLLYVGLVVNSRISPGT